MAKHQLPVESDEQAIGHMAERTLEARAPFTWRRTSLDGTSDAGLDINVQVVTQGNYRAAFRLQLKGTTVPERSADGSYFSISLKGSTVRYWDGFQEPILLVLCDLSADNDPRKCPAYYVWTHHEIARRREETPGVVEDNDYISFRIPAANQLADDFDVEPELNRQRALAKAGPSMAKAIGQIHPTMGADDVSKRVEAVSKSIASHGGTLVDVVSAPPTSYWPQAPEGSVAGRLNHIAELLRSGRYAEAQPSLEALSADVIHAGSLEKAEFCYLEAQIALEMDGAAASVSLHRRAWELSGQPKHLAAYAEMAMHSVHEAQGSAEEYDRLIALLEDKDESVQALKARLLFLRGREDEARAVLAPLPEKSRWLAEVINAISQLRYDEAIALCDRVLEISTPGQKGRSLYFLFRARAWFYKAVGPLPEEGDHFPYTGPATLDLDALTRCWEDVGDTVRLLSLSHWPRNVEFIVDVWGAAALMLGRAAETLPQLKAAADARPNLPALQRTFETIAVHANDYESALIANERNQEDPRAAIRRVTLYFNSKKIKQCIAQLDKIFDQLDGSPDSSLSLSMGIVAAELKFDAARCERYEKRLDEFPDAPIQKAWLAMLRSSNVPGAAPATPIMRQAFDGSHKAAGLGLQLIMQLKAEDRDQAAEILDIAPQVRQWMNLPSEIELHVAQALVTREEWSLLLQLGENGERRFPNQERYLAVQAFALDKLGRSAEAGDKLEKLFSAGTEDDLALHIYINIAARTGFLEKAIELCERALEATSDVKRKKGYLRFLIEMLARQDPTSRRIEDVAWQIGQLTDQNDELDEGSFLLLYLMAGINGAAPGNEERIQEFRARSQAFVEKFPNSKILRTFTAPENFTLEALEGMLEKIDPNFRQRAEFKSRLVRQIDGGAPCPYIWRPRFVLQDIPDLPTLWHVGKISSRRIFHLTMATSGRNPVTRSEIAGRIPLLDFPALLVISELDLFDLLFKVFPQVAVTQELYRTLTNLTGPLSFGVSRAAAQKVLDSLKAHFKSIISPATPAASEDDDDNDRAEMGFDIKSLAKSEGLILYSDDAVFRFYCEVAGKPSLCSLDLLHIAETESSIEVREAAKNVAKLCEWNVGLLITRRILAAAMPERLPGAKGLSVAVQMLKDDPVSGPILRGVWHLDNRPYQNLHTYAVALVTPWIDDEQNDLRSVTALVCAWYTQARFHKELAKMEQISHFAWFMADVASQIQHKEQGIARRFWSVYRDILPIVYGDRMDEAREREGIQRLGIAIARRGGAADKVGAALALQGFLNSGLVEGASDHDHFNRGYNDEVKAGRR